MEHRLAAILAADVVGYLRLVRADEEGTLRTLSAYRMLLSCFHRISENLRRFGAPGNVRRHRMSPRRLIG